MKLWNRFVKIFEAVSKLFLWIAEAAVAAMILLITASIIIRMCGGVANFSDELSGYLLVILVYFGLAYTQQLDKLIVVDILTSHLPPKTVKILKIPVFIIAISFLIVLSKYVKTIISTSIARHTTSLTSLAIPLWIPQVMIIIGLVMLIVRMFIDLVNTILELCGLRKEETS